MEGLIVCKLTAFANELELQACNPEVNTEEINITTRDINRPGLQFAGYLDDFDHNRIQIVGYMEYIYLKSIEQHLRTKNLLDLFCLGAPCYVFCRNIKPDHDLLHMATNANIPIFTANVPTSEFMSSSIQWLNVKLAHPILRHGCLCDINGVGIFIQGESGIGKSEALLELIKRGHRMIADDAVEIRKVSESYLIGSAPEVLWGYMEIRGIGIVNIKSMFGIQSLKRNHEIEVVVKLEKWNPDTEFDRLGLDMEYIVVHGIRLPLYRIPVMPGRNIAVIIEAIALHYRQHQLGYHDVEDFVRNVKITL